MKPMLIAANWKMNKNYSEAFEYVRELRESFTAKKDRQIVVCPPFISLSAFKQFKIELNRVGIFYGAQNCHWETSGAFTGEVSASMLHNEGCGYCIVGHSERRTQFKETEEEIAKKVKAVQDADLIPILCIGETEAERARGETIDILAYQMREGLSRRVTGKQVVVAYEPVWSIGTGNVPFMGEIKDIHEFIRKKCVEFLGEDLGNRTSILYGGSVNPQNAKEIEEVANVNGFLIGGASLKVESLLAIY
jgi:triosephosphate isomerase